MAGVSWVELPISYFSHFLLQLEHHKNYQDETEERFRMKIYNENKHKIAKHNQRYATGKVSYKMALNKYADMLHHEFQQKMNGFNYTLHKQLRYVNHIITLYILKL